MTILRKVSQSCLTGWVAPWVLLALVAMLFLAMFATTVRADNDDCAMCHADAGMFDDSSMVVDDASLEQSVHAGFECVMCHTSLADVDDFPHDDDLPPADCSTCHEGAVDEYQSSWHAEYASTHPTDRLSPNCGSCHTAHDIRPSSDTLSSTYPLNLPATCGNCHTEIALGRTSGLKRADAYARYEGGVHADRMKEGILEAATCNDCHGYHRLRKASDPQSKVYKYNIPETCGECHTEVYSQYERGIHGKALKAGVTDSPNCSDCHGEHAILAVHDPNSPVSAAHQADRVCASCHNNPQLVAKYGLAEGQISSYQDSYHGLAARRGSPNAASCASCHEAHDILPASDPASTVAPGNIVATCQKCHAGATLEFATSYSHEEILGTKDSLKGIIELIYIPLIIIVIGGMGVHNGLIMIHYIRKRQAQMGQETTYERFTPTMVWQHGLFALSFITLAITGFALKFPDAWWAQPLNWIGLSEYARSIIHRICGVVMMAVSIHHVIYVITSRRGRTEFFHIIPRLSDVREAVQNIKYYLGWSRVKPDFDRYDYTEKAEYWALVWGTIVMVATGLVLWFPEAMTKIFPGWIVIVSETIHYYEAWLATLAIVVWHFFFVIFHPEEYPMSTVWIRGRISEHHMKAKHPKWYRRLVGEESRERAADAERTSASSSDDAKRPENNG
ncbi:MAG: cytochrome c3 family protein [Candidatus Zixiibacteriota bacterium]